MAVNLEPPSLLNQETVHHETTTNLDCQTETGCVIEDSTEVSAGKNPEFANESGTPPVFFVSGAITEL
jgi:hypothetical protein